MHAFTPERRQLALITYRNSNIMSHGVLKFVDLQTWQVVTATLTFNNANDNLA